LITAERFNHNLTLQFGLLAGDCSDDNDYLQKANELIIKWGKDLPKSINDIFFDKAKPGISSFTNIILEIKNHIEKVINIAIDKRKFEF